MADPYTDESYDLLDEVMGYELSSEYTFDEDEFIYSNDDFDWETLDTLY